VAGAFADSASIKNLGVHAVGLFALQASIRIARRGTVSHFKSQFFRDLIFFAFAAAMLFVGGYGILLIMQVLGGNGSSEGNSLIFVMGLVLIILSAFSLIIGVLHRKSGSSAEDSKKSQ
jgi:hypothetical protein